MNDDVSIGVHPGLEVYASAARRQSETRPRFKRNMHTLDLNLLVVFNAVMQERNLTRAGQRLGMSQPTVSHALARLRQILKDDLFVRTPEGMRPTPRAERMSLPLRAALHELHVTLEGDEFDAARSSRGFTIAANNDAARALIPALVCQIAQLAPAVVLNVRPTDTPHVLDLLDSGEVELALTILTDGGDRFKCVGLPDDEYVVILSSNNPAAAEPGLSITNFAGMPHIASSSDGGGDMQFIDTALAEQGLERVVRAKVPLHSLIVMLMDSSSLAVLPRRVAIGLAAIGPLTIRALPFTAPRAPISMIWHRRLDNSPAHRWLRGTLRATVAGA